LTLLLGSNVIFLNFIFLFSTDFSDFTSENPESSTNSSTSPSTSQQGNPDDSQPGSSTQTSQETPSQNASNSTASSNSNVSVDRNGHSKTTGRGEAETAGRGGGNASRKRTLISESQCPKKPTLFTMNPLCIPVNVIKMNPIINVTIGQLNNVKTPELPLSQTLVAQQKESLLYEVQNKKISPHPKHPIHQQQLQAVQHGKKRKQHEVYICEPHPETVIVRHDAPVGRRNKIKTK
jgi:hypothetical protein